MNYRLIFSMLAVFLFLPIAAIAKSDKPLQYDIEAAGSGVQGTYLVRVWVYSKSGKVSDEDIKKAAVHGVIFRGFNGGQGSPSQRPIATSTTLEEEKAEYFKAFFSSAYLQYANIVSGSYQRMKAAKEYKVGAIVQVNKDNLRRELEQAGIVKGLSNGF